jgi:triphosphoribosyl-dephospho-CoA synthase
MTPDRRLQAELKNAYLRACEVELQALKPGNVSIEVPGHDMCAADFIASAVASASVLVTPELGLGERIYQAIAATREQIGCNTNLGIVLLCAPLLHAELTYGSSRDGLCERLKHALCTANIEDTQWLYRAIRLASPGGLGRSELHDVSETPTVPVVTAMQAAAHRDRIALQYSTGYSDVFGYAVPRLLEYRARWKSDIWAAVAVFIGLLRRFPDSHIARKFGGARAKAISARAARLDAELSQCNAPQEITQRLKAVDAEFKSAGINPGTTADLTVASLAVLYLEELLSTDTRDLSLSMKAQGDRYRGRKGSQDLKAQLTPTPPSQAPCRPCRVSL